MAGPWSKKRPTVRSPSGILTNAATTGGVPGTGGGGGPANTMFAAGGAGAGTGAGATPAVIAAQRPQFGAQANTMLAAGGAGGGTGMGATPAVMAAQRPQSRAPHQLLADRAASAPSMIAGPMAQAQQQPMVTAPYAPGGGLQGSAGAVGSAGAMGSAPNTPGTAAGWRPAPGVLEGLRYQAAGEAYYDPATGGNTPAYEAMLDAPTAFSQPSDQEVLDWLGTSDAQNLLGITPGGPADPAAPAVAAPVTTIEDSYADMYGDMRDDAGTAFDTSEAYFTNEGTLAGDYWSGVGDRAGGYWDDRGTAAEDYYGGARDDTLEYLTGRQGREQEQILAMANMQRGNVGDQYQWMTDALNTEETRRGGVYDELETTRGARLDTNEAALLGQMGTLEGERLTQEQAMAEALGGRYTTAQGGLDQRRLGAETALREQGVGPEAYTTAVGAETAALLGSQGLSSQDLQGRLASIAASEATDRSLGATGMFQDARTALADQLFGGRADLAENIAGRRTSFGQQNLEALAGIGTGELGSQQSLLNEIAQGQFGAGQTYGAGMYGAGEQIAAGRFNADEAALTGAFGAGQTQRAGMYGAQQSYESEVSRIDQLEASGQISRAEAAQAKSEAEMKASQAQATEAAQFAQIDTQMGLEPGTAQAMSTGGLLGDLYGDMMGSTAGQYENMMPWTSAGGGSYFVDPEIAMREEIRQGQGVTTVPQATYPVQIPGPDGQMITVQMPINNWSDITSMQEYEALR